MEVESYRQKQVKRPFLVTKDSYPIVFRVNLVTNMRTVQQSNSNNNRPTCSIVKSKGNTLLASWAHFLLPTLLQCIFDFHRDR
jgi:hypothetical protein